MLPEEFTNRLEGSLGEAVARRIVASMHAPKAIGLWCNPLRRPADATSDVQIAQLCHDLSAGEAVPVAQQLPDCFRLETELRDRLMHHQRVTSGQFYPINPSSLFAARALDVQPGDEVLDLAAAPGGKSLVLAAALSAGGRATGRLALVEPVKARFHRLRANMERCGVLQADYYQRDGRGVGSAVPNRFDRVLLDAPCSSEARFHVQEPERMAHWSPRKVKECARKQKSLLKSAFAALKPGGTLVYSTCSYSTEENERIVHGLLRREPAARLCEIETAEDIRQRSLSGLTSAQLGGKAKFDVGQAQRLLPDDLWDGFFLAKLTKAS